MNSRLEKFLGVSDRNIGYRLFTLCPANCMSCLSLFLQGCMNILFNLVYNAMQWLVQWFGCRCLQLTKYTFMSSFNMLKKKLHHAVDTKIFLKRQTTFFHYSISLLFKTYFKMNLIQFQKLYGKEHICIVALEKFHRGDSSRLWFLVELIIFINMMYISKDLIHNNWIWHNWKTFSNLLLS